MLMECNEYLCIGMETIHKYGSIVLADALHSQSHVVNNCAALCSDFPQDGKLVSILIRISHDCCKALQATCVQYYASRLGYALELYTNTRNDRLEGEFSSPALNIRGPRSSLDSDGSSTAYTRCIIYDLDCITI